MENVPPMPADRARVRMPDPESTVPHQPPIPPRTSPAPTAVDPHAADAVPVSTRNPGSTGIREPPARTGGPRSRRIEPRHRIGASVAELIGPAIAPDSGTRRRATVGGAHRDPPRTGRHRAEPADPGVDSLARRRTIGGRPDRGVGRTAL